MKSIYTKLVEPAIAELPFFILFALSLLPKTIYYLNTSYCSWEDYPLFRYVSLAFLYSYILTLIVHYTKPKALKITFYGFTLLINLISFFLAFNFKASISPSTILLLAETNVQEATEFLHQYLLSAKSILCYFIILVGAFIIWISERTYHKYKFKSLPTCLKVVFSIVLLVFLTGGVYACKHHINMYQCKSTTAIDDWMISSFALPMDNISNLMFCGHNLNLCNKELTLAVNVTKDAVKAMPETERNDSLNVIFILGESYIKWHSSLYGYPLNTTPYLLKEQESSHLFAFTNVVTSFNTTSKSVRNIFSCNSLSSGEQWNTKPFFPAIMKKAGFDVYLWDNQYDKKSNASYDFSLNAYLHNKELTRYTYTSTNNARYRYDGDLIDSFDQVRTREGNNLIIFHLMGQHLEAGDRYPHNSKFHRFTKDSIQTFRHESYLNDKKLNTIADYDNATYYNDYVIHKVIDKNKDKNSIIIYFSDHGEEVFDIRDYYGRAYDDKPTPDIQKYQYEIPFVIWCSSKYMEKNPDIVNDIRNSVNIPFNVENVCHLFFRVANISTSFYDATRDLIKKGKV